MAFFKMVGSICELWHPQFLLKISNKYKRISIKGNKHVQSQCSVVKFLLNC